MYSSVDLGGSSILIKNLNDPLVKDYYSTEDINDQLSRYEGVEVKVEFLEIPKNKEVKFHIDYYDYLSSIPNFVAIEEDEAAKNRIEKFIRFSAIVE